MDTATHTSGTRDGPPADTRAGTSPATPTALATASRTAALFTDAVLTGAPLTGAPACPKCGGRMWDNRASKRNPRAPDFKCRQRSCDGVLWPGQHRAATPIITARQAQPESTDDERTPATTTAPSPSDATDPSRRARLRRCYLELAEFVLREVRPKYEAAGVPCRDSTLAAITATLFIAACHGEGN